jgi:hypothetical protein
LAGSKCFAIELIYLQSHQSAYKTTHEKAIPETRKKKKERKKWEEASEPIMDP